MLVNNGGRYKKNARSNMDFIKSNNKNKYVNYWSKKTQKINVMEEIDKISQIIGDDAKMMP